MGIMKTKQSFNEIFAETNIVPRYFSLIQQAITTSITNGKFAVIAKYDMNCKIFFINFSGGCKI